MYSFIFTSLERGSDPTPLVEKRFSKFGALEKLTKKRNISTLGFSSNF
jgi:hypothetical protein